MPKYRVGTLITGYYDLGEVEANSKEEAIEKAFENVGSNEVHLCYQCLREVGNLYLSDDKKEIEVEEIE